MVRLLLGFALNVGLWSVAQGFSMWRNYDREFRLLLLSGGLSVAALVAVVPVIWRGKSWQLTIAFLLLFLPTFGLLGTILTALFGL
jgi:hypothetical protein